ncbi:MAG: protease modulator HflK, partial [Luteibacter sp.]
IAATAEAERAERVAAATGDADRFNLLLKEYRAAPDVTRRRLWLETIQDVMSRNQKVVDGSNGKNIIQLPVEASGNASVRSVPGVGAIVQSATTDATPVQPGSAQ